MKKFFVIIPFILVFLLMITGCKVKKVEDVTDQEKIAIEYNISKKNSFQYVTYDELNHLFEKGNAILFFGYPENDYTKELANILLQVTEDKILYYNPKNIMDNDDIKYKNLLEKLQVKKLEIPSVYFIQDGKVVNMEDTLAKLEITDYFTEEDRKQLKEKYQLLIDEYFESREY